VNEPPEDWRPLYKEKLAAVVDSLLSEGAGAYETAEYLSSCLVDPDNIFYHLFKLDLPASTTLKIKIGTCKELSPLGIYALRTVGIPVAYDFTPQWANRSMGHNWSLLLATRPPLAFSFGDGAASFGNHLEAKKGDKFAKIYRKMYSIQDESPVMQAVKEDIPVLFGNPFLKDVTKEYIETVDLKIKLTRKPSSSKQIAYIMVFNNREWAPVHWGKIKHNTAMFTDMSKGCAYIAMYYHSNSFYPASVPFYVDEEGKVKLLEPDTTHRVSALLKRKYHSLFVDNYVRELEGGKFQVADDLHFTTPTDLHTIENIPEAVCHTIEVAPVNRHRYFRYIAGEGKSGNMAEIEVFNEKGEKLKGTVIGTEDSLARQSRNNVFDGEVLTYFDVNMPHKAWVGLAFNKEERIRKIKYYPRNDDNFIRDNELYELFYWDAQWVSLGRQSGKEEMQSLTYTNVPENALLLLRNLTKGNEERIFTYENGKQVWW
jgi:hypothetical protein